MTDHHGSWSEKNRLVVIYDQYDWKLTTTKILLFKRVLKNYLLNTKINLMIMKKKNGLHYQLRDKAID